MHLHIKLWVQNLGMAWEGVRHPRLLGSRPPLCVAKPYLDKEIIKGALNLNLNIHHALKQNSRHSMLKITSQFIRKQIKTKSNILS